jgi:hypothetical protein
MTLDDGIVGEENDKAIMETLNSTLSTMSGRQLSNRRISRKPAHLILRDIVIHPAIK